MCLEKLAIHQVRNICGQTMEPSPNLNFIYGENGSGKSAVLEAIFILGRARSFRTSLIKTVINEQEKCLLVTGQLSLDRLPAQQLGIQIDSKATEIRINQHSTNNRSDLAYALPLQLIHPKSYELLDAGPSLRREFLDWGVFNREQQFLPAWRLFKRALSQRNALLKNPRYGAVSVWDKELAKHGTLVDRLRRHYLQEFRPVFMEIARQFMEINGLALSLVSGWDVTEDLEQVLAAGLEKDLHYGFTQNGPHRADLILTLNGHLARDFVSRGQLKLLVLSLKLAQIELLAEKQGNGGCVLMDDFSAELDSRNRCKLLHYLAQIKCQAFVTAAEVADFGDLTSFANFKLFHMEHGNIKQRQ